MLCKKIFNIEITVNSQVDSPYHSMGNNDHFPAKEGTSTKPIRLDEDQEEQRPKRFCQKQEDGQPV